MRLYEAHGARGTARLKLGTAVTAASYCDLLEQAQRDAKVSGDGTVEVPYRPFQIITLKID